VATIYKATRKRPIPKGAEILESRGKRFAKWTDGKRNRRAPLSADGLSIVVEAAGYSIQYFDHNGKRRKKTTRCPDRDAVERLANALETGAMNRREGLIDPAQERMAQQARRSLAEHVTDFERFLTDKGNTSKHVRMTCRHVRWVADKCEAQSLADLTGPGVLAAVGELRGGGTSLRTCNSYLRSIKSFSRWLWRHKRRSDDPLCALESFNEETDPRHVRRELLPEEVARLLASAENRTRPEHNLPGPDRAMLYRLALGTGFRANELRSLAPTSFDLDSDPPTVTVTAAHSKRRREDRQPIRHDLAGMLRPWLAARPEGERLFAKLPGDTARMLRSDLAAARSEWIDEAPTQGEREARERSDFLAYRNAAGEVADFHSTRHTYVSGIVAGGASVKTCQELARHSSPSLTIGRYSHARLHDLQGALESLPSATPAPTEPERQILAATGTDNAQPIPEALDTTNESGGHIWGQLNGETRQNMAGNDESATKLTVEVDKAQVVSLPIVGEERREKGKRRRWESDPRWRICNPLP
jgi:integrase